MPGSRFINKERIFFSTQITQPYKRNSSSQMQWNQNASSPSVNVVYPQTQNVLSPNPYPSATYSFTADFRSPNQSDPLITATSTFKPLIQNSQKPPNYIFQQKPGYGSQKTIGQFKRSPQKIFEGTKAHDQEMGAGYVLNHQGQMYSSQDFGYGHTACLNSGKVEVRND